MFCQLVEYLEENKLIHPNLHGSRAGHNTSTALIQLYDKWVEDVEDGKMVGVLLCDQSAAFDLCDHHLLIEKLKLMGVEDHSLYWIKSYLSSRRQSCYVDGELSTSLNLLDCGVPQGSIGGPLLWLCFTCDQPDVIHDHEVNGQDLQRGCGVQAGTEGDVQVQQELLPAVDVQADVDQRGLDTQEREGAFEAVHQGIVQVRPVVQVGDCGELVGYVDDGAYSYAHRDPAVLSRVLTEKYNMLEDWMNNNMLVINPDKTHLMVMGSKKADALRQQVCLRAGTYVIKPTENETLLGGHINQSLKWNQHILDNKASMIRQLTSRNNGLKRIAKNATFCTRLMIANGVVMSKLVYLITLWGGAQQYLLKALLVQQMTAARTVCGFKCWGWSRRRLLNKVGWMSVRQLIYFHTVLQAHKTITSGIPRPLHADLPTDHPYRTRSSSCGNIRFDKSITSTSTFKYRAMVWYNSVPGKIKDGSLQTVKRKLKQWVHQNVPVDWG